MLFNSHEFLFLFLPIACAGFFALAQRRLTQGALAWLLCASLVFYAYWDYRYLPVLLISIVINYALGTALRRRKSLTVLAAGVMLNLSALAYFKYAHFVLDNLATLVGTRVTMETPTLPLGISFFTFTQLAWLVDAYRGEARSTSLLHYSLFVTFFPHLIAGPILHHRNILPQFHRLRMFVWSQKNVAHGLVWFSLGLFKKVVIADHLSSWVQPVFAQPQAATFLDAWVGALGYFLQLYFDFSGYSDMAIGLGYLFNVTLPANFNSPYQAVSIIDFWRRWHMTLAWFLREYLYFPLGGNRRGYLRQVVNMFVTMVLCGLWHGAGWTFVLWGALHGLYLIVNHGWRQLGLVLPTPFAWLLTFLSVLIGWVVFRAQTIGDALVLLRTMAGLDGIALPAKYQSLFPQLADWGARFTNTVLMRSNLDHLAAIIVLLIAVLALPNTMELSRRFTPSWRWLAFAAFAAGSSIFLLRRGSEFLYFQF
ncbi:MAG TPA: MBOAT family O-acyltransferase [Nitrospiraceae bacterium]|nr:MBOAT family O-acyltransferase [Nitrospiraceae bacterium]